MPKNSVSTRLRFGDRGLNIWNLPSLRQRHTLLCGLEMAISVRWAGWFLVVRPPQVAPKSVDGARRFRRHDSRLNAIWTFHRHGSLLRDQDGASRQLRASTPNRLAHEAGAEALSLWEEIWPGPAIKLVGPLAARSPGLRLALDHEIERHLQRG